MRKLLLIGLLCCLCGMLGAQNKKSDLKVLYVGGSADMETSGVKVDSAALQKSVAERTASFEKMLKKYFKTVGVVQGKDYTMGMSDDYDVTIFDGKIKELTPTKIVRDAEGNVTEYKRASYLTEDFDRPAIVVAEMGETLGRSIGLKTDWYCLCLDADAHHFRTEHPIFKGPFPVKMTIQMRPTPEGAYHYTYYYDGELPDSIPMWKVQTKGYMTDEGFRVGMVSRPWGFEDSPDAEYISSGVCAKTLDAVAIGRHGNFLHWGFSASPRYMTDEAKAVFANAVVYISQFAGQAPIARKYNDRIATREYLKELKYLATRAAWQERVESDKEWVKLMLKEKEEAQAKQARGEELSEDEKRRLDYVPQPSMTYEDMLKRYQDSAFYMFGTDEQAYLDYYDTNKDWFYGEGFYNLTVDEDAKAWGIPNNDIRLLDKAISEWEKGGEVERAKRVLERYTLCRFTTPQEWRAWYEANKGRLFFTESGGWLFMVDTRDKSVPGNDYSAKEQKLAATAATSAAASASKLVTDDKNPVRAEMVVENGAGGNKVLVVRVKIHPGYHIYASVGQGDAFIPTTLDFTLPAGYEKAGDLQRSSFKGYNSTGTTIYEDKAEFRQPIRGNGAGTAQCTLGYQCCDAHICFPPTELKLLVEVK